MALLLSLFTVASVVGFGSSSASDGGLTFLGKLEIPKGTSTDQGITWPGIDVVNRRLYIAYSTGIAEYDLNKTVPKLIRTVPFFPAGQALTPYSMTIDSLHRRAFVIDTSPNSSGAVKVIQTLDLKTLRYTGKSWAIETALPGFDPMGITYSAADHRVYVAGMFAAGTGSSMYAGVPPVFVPSAIVALDDTTGKIVWWKVIPQCQFLAGQYTWGSPLFRSQRYQALYFLCLRPSTAGTLVALEYPGESGLVRLRITPNATQADAGNFQTEFFPVAGHYAADDGTSTLATFDPVADRIFLVNQSSTTPGMWAFDGSLPAWVGFVGAVDNGDSGTGIDQTTGHVYLLSGITGTPHIIITAGRSTPVPEGTISPFHPINTANIWMVDGPTHRLFLPMQSGGIYVLQDRTPAVPQTQAINYDTLTADVPESGSTVETFAGDAAGYGARALLVGGYGGLIDPANEAAQTSQSISGFSPGDRSITAANVPSLDLRDTGAAASAQSVAPDSLTQNDYSTQQQNVQTHGNDVNAGTGDSTAEMLNWKWPAATCLDAGDDKQELTQPGPGGNSSVVCDMAKAVDTASTYFDAFTVGGLTVGYSSFGATSQRDPKHGIVTEATAVVRDVHIPVDGGGTLFIQRVEATAKTVAHGRTGSANASWQPLIEGVTLRDSSGHVIFSCDQCDPNQVATQVNDSVLATKIRILLPSALLQRTPHGAYASVGKTGPDYWSGLTMNDDNSHAVPAMQIELYNDYGQKSRLVLQLAAIQASSIYGISVLPTYQQPGATGGSTGSILPPLAHGTGGGSTTVDGKYVNGGGTTGSTFRRFVLGVGALVRSPKDAALFALVCLLFGGAAAVVRRRQLLASSLEESSR